MSEIKKTQDFPKKQWWQLKLRGKFILVISAILAIIFGLMAFFLVRSARANLTNGLNRETQAFASLATKPIGDNFVVYHQSGTILVQQQMQKFASLDTNVSNIAVVNLQGLSQFSLNGKPISVSTEAVSSFNPTTQTNSKGQIVLAVQPYIDDSGQHSYAIVYQISAHQVEQTISRQELTILILMLLGLLISGLATYEFINFFFLLPINSLTKSASLVAAGNYGLLPQSRRYDEIGTLDRSINNMATTLKANIAKLQELDSQKDEFIKIVSHNLRTPLTIIQSNAAFLENANLDKALQKMVQGIEDSARRLNLFSEQILTITDFESKLGGSSLRQEATFNDMLGSLSQEYGELAANKGITFKSEIQNGTTKFFTSQYLVAQAVRNLLDNAFKFTSEGGIITLAAELGDKAVIKVADTGIGIKPEELPKLFTKFHRASSTLVYNYEGTGIGLYVSRLIIEQQGGRIYAQSQLGKGSVFTIELPLIKGISGESIQ
jgi:signal transduction histidine kinase